MPFSSHSAKSLIDLPTLGNHVHLEVCSNNHPPLRPADDMPLPWRPIPWPSNAPCSRNLSQTIARLSLRPCSNKPMGFGIKDKELSIIGTPVVFFSHSHYFCRHYNYCSLQAIRMFLESQPIICIPAPQQYKKGSLKRATVVLWALAVVL